MIAVARAARVAAHRARPVPCGGRAVARSGVARGRLAPFVWALLAATLLHAAAARADPPAREDIVKWCNDTEDTAECLRVIESHQLAKLPGLATRNGGELRVTLFPSGSTVFTDAPSLSGGLSYSLWDNWSAINAVVVAATRDDHTTYDLLLRGNGKRFALPAEPVLAPDRQHLVTADFCAAGCSNELVVWRVSRDEVAKAASWKPSPTWSDVVAGWKDGQTLSLEFTPMGASESRTEARKLDDPVFRGK